MAAMPRSLSVQVCMHRLPRWTLQTAPTAAVATSCWQVRATDMCLCRARRLMQSFQAMLIWLHAPVNPLRLSFPHTRNQLPTVPVELPACSPRSTQSQIKGSSHLVACQPYPTSPEQCSRPAAMWRSLCNGCSLLPVRSCLCYRNQFREVTTARKRTRTPSTPSPAACLVPVATPQRGLRQV